MGQHADVGSGGSNQPSDGVAASDGNSSHTRGSHVLAVLAVQQAGAFSRCSGQDPPPNGTQHVWKTPWQKYTYIRSSKHDELVRNSPVRCGNWVGRDTYEPPHRQVQHRRQRRGYDL
jgi:hypothetical protein